MVHEDYERDFLKDAIYLQERTALLEKELMGLRDDLKRMDATFFIVKEKEKEHDGKVGLDVLPF